MVLACIVVYFFAGNALADETVIPTLEWAALFDGVISNTDNMGAMVVDSDGNIYIAGISRPTVGNQYWLIVKYDKALNEIWRARYKDAEVSDVKGIAVDSDGNVYVTGIVSISGWQSGTVKYNSAGEYQWYATHLSSSPCGIGVHEDDSDGKTYVYISSEGFDSNSASNSKDYTTIKYDAADGSEEWVAIYDGPDGLADSPSALAVDDAGNVYVTGSSRGTSTNDDCATVKYDKAGAQQWATRYAGTETAADYANAISVDSSGNVYVAGRNNSDYLTLKYNSSGVEQWAETYDGPGGSADIALAIAVDSEGNVYATGYSIGDGTFADYATVKYNSAGTQQWVSRYNGLESGHDNAYAIVVDDSGNTYITGSSEGTDAVSYNNYDYATVKYNSAGVEQWVQRYGDDETREEGFGLVLYNDNSDLYVYTVGDAGGLAGSDQGYDFGIVKYDIIDGAESASERCDEEGSSDSQAIDLDVDSSGNVYVLGITDVEDDNHEYLLAKYNPNGIELWTRKRASAAYFSYGPDEQPAGAMVLDANGNAYITGIIDGYDWVVAKYDAGGTEKWVETYDNGSSDMPVDIGLYVDGDDGKVYIYVAGSSINAGTMRSEYTVIRYDAEGTQQWVRKYNLVGVDRSDDPRALAVDSIGNVYVTGTSKTASDFYAYATVKFDKYGVEKWSQGYGPFDDANYASHEARDIAVDGSGNVYVTGTSYDGARNDLSTGFDYATIKYDAEGTELWVARYNGEGKQNYVYDSNDAANALALDGDGNVYVTGGSGVADNTWATGYATVKYDAGGNELWVERYQGDSDTYSDLATALWVDGFGRIYVTGKTGTGSDTSDYATIAYDGDGKQLWLERYNGGGTGHDSHSLPFDLVVRDNGHVYVTGQTVGVGTGKDFCTLMYSQSTEITDTDPPVVDTTSPEDNTTGVLITALVTATFNEPMDPATFTNLTFTLEEKNTASPVAGTVTYDEGILTARFQPDADLAFGTAYTATLTSDATDLAGNPLALTKLDFFTETEPDVEAPKITSTTPENEAGDVSITTVVAAAFDEPMDGDSLTSSTFLLAETVSGNAIAGTVTYDAGFMEGRFDLTVSLSYETAYTATLTTGVTDLAGNPLEAEYSWTFTTNAEPDLTPPGVIPASLSPADMATNVPVSLGGVSVQFNEPMNQGSINAGTFTLTNKDTGAAVTPQSVTYTAGTAQFNLGSTLTNATTYEVTISGEVMDLADNVMEDDVTWRFKTVFPPPPPSPPDTDAPFVSSVTPANGMDRIPIDREIWDLGLLTATFNEAMDRASIEAIGTFTLEQDATGTPVAVRAEYDAAALTARCYPLTDLDPNTLYKATITTAATDSGGNHMDSPAYDWTFRTGYDPTEPCYPELEQTAGCTNFDHLTFGVGAQIQRNVGGTGFLSEGARRATVTDGEDHIHKEYQDADIESEAEATLSSATFKLRVRSQEKAINGSAHGARALAASKIAVTGVPARTAIPVTVVIDSSFQGLGVVEIQIFDFENEWGLGSVRIHSRSDDSYAWRIDPFGPDEHDNFESPDRSIPAGKTEFEFLYPATPNNGIYLYAVANASRQENDAVSAEADATIKIRFDPPPGATVTLATGQTFVGEFDSDGDGVPDSEESLLNRNDAMVATPAAATGSGPIEVDISGTADGGMSLSQVQTFSAWDPFVNQTDKPTPATRTFPDGLVSFRLNGVVGPNPVTVTLTFPTNIPAGAKYYKVNADGFYEFPHADIFGNTVTLTLRDTGTEDGGDSSGAGGDGVIVDPGGVGFPADTTTADGGGGGGGGCFIQTLQ